MHTLPTHISAVACNTILDLLFPMFLAAAGNADAARQAAIAALAEYRPDSAEELGLGAEIIALRFHALRAMREAAALPTTDAATALLRTANALRRNEAVAQRKLDALQRARRAPAQKAAAKAAKAAPQESTPPAPETPTPAEPRAATGSAAPARSLARTQPAAPSDGVLRRAAAELAVGRQPREEDLRQALSGMGAGCGSGLVSHRALTTTAAVV